MQPKRTHVKTPTYNTRGAGGSSLPLVCQHTTRAAGATKPSTVPDIDSPAAGETRAEGDRTEGRKASSQVALSPKDHAGINATGHGRQGMNGIAGDASHRNKRKNNVRGYDTHLTLHRTLNSRIKLCICYTLVNQNNSNALFPSVL